MSLTPRRIGRIALGFFFRGLLLLVPVTIMLWAVWYVLEFLDSLIDVDIPGLGLLILVVSITVVGWLGSTILYQPFAEIGEEILKRVPFLKTFYDALKDLMEALVGSKKKFDRPVLVKLGEGMDVERVGFVTQDDLQYLGVQEGKVAVYMPHAFNWSGNLYIVPIRNITPIDARATDVMKFVVSGGVSQADDEAE